MMATSITKHENTPGAWVKVTKRLPTGRQGFRLSVKITCKALRDDKRNLLLTIRALNLKWYGTGILTVNVERDLFSK